MTFRLGILGLGLMGQRLLRSLGPHPGFDVVVGHDADPERCQAVADACGFQALGSTDAVLDHDGLDVVYIATPPASHVPLATAALERGLPVFVEKPLAVDLAAAEGLVTLAEERGLAHAMNFPLATLPGLARVKRELSEGTAGAPRRVEIVLHFSQWPRSWHDAGPWLAGRDEGGFVREVFSHFAELTQRYLGPLELVQARVEHDDPERTETRVEASFRAGEVPVSLLGGVGGAAPDFNRWTLFAEERSYRVEDWSQVSWSDGSSWEAMPLQPDESPGLDAQLDQLAALLRGEPSLLPTLRDGLTVQRAIEAVLAT